MRSRFDILVVYIVSPFGDNSSMKCIGLLNSYMYGGMDFKKVIGCIKRHLAQTHILFLAIGYMLLLIMYFLICIEVALHLRTFSYGGK